jgi:hypothetical protein
MRNYFGWAVALAVLAVGLAGTTARSQTFRLLRAGPGSPAPSAPSVESIRERAAQIAKYRDLLADKDQTVREAAFTEMANSTDPALQEIAYETGFASGELSMRALALRTRLTHWTAFSFDVEDTIGEERTTKLMPATVTYHAGGADQAHGTLILADRPIQTVNDAQGQIGTSGLEVIVDVRKMQPMCWGRMRLNDAGELVGTLTCVPPGVCCPTLTVKAKTRMF